MRGPRGSARRAPPARAGRVPAGSGCRRYRRAAGGAGRGAWPGTNGSAARFRSMRAILGLAGLALVLSASAAAFAEVPLPPPRPEGIAEEAVATGDVPLPPVRPHGIENEHPSVDGAAAGAAAQPEGED